MRDLILKNESWIRFAAFAAVFVAMAACEAVRERRKRVIPRIRRWPSNLGIFAFDILLFRIAMPVGAVGVALIAEERGFGILNWTGTALWLAIPLAILVLDLAIYLQHVVFHRVPVLWRLHRMHHADVELDVTSGTRFHPIEIGISLGVKLAVVAAVGASPIAVLLFEALLNATAMFNHANIRLPEHIDRVLRLVLVTPDMHRVHHSVVRQETNSNFGFNLPWWDRVFGTYRAEPAAGHDAMIIGLDSFRNPSEQTLGRLLTQPFRDDPASSARSNLSDG